jgi:hypothetical protein
MRRNTLFAAAAVVLAAAAVAPGIAGASPTVAGRMSPAAEAFSHTTRSTPWNLVRKVKLDFPTYHPQGLAQAGDRLFLSSVEITEPPVKYPEPRDGYDRSTGKGVGHVFVLTRDGKLLRDIVVGEGTMYHPGGIDYDGENVWVPVAEYRPDSRSVVYTIDPETFQVTEQFRYADHVGGVVRDPSTGTVHGVSWGSRTFFSWSEKGRLLRSSANESHYVDYQDCDTSGDQLQLCSGIAALQTASGGSYELGGVALIDLRDNTTLHEVPFPYFSSAGHVATRNPVTLEKDGGTLRMIAAPDDGEEAVGTELLVYEAPVG